LPFYSIENLLFHPDNIASLNLPGFDPAAWRDAIRSARDERPLREIKYARERISELRLVEDFQRARSQEADPKEIYDAYESPDFDIFYTVLPMKELPRTYLEPFNISTGELARAPWMVAKLKEITA
jgi:hypothetical protein